MKARPTRPVPSDRWRWCWTTRITSWSRYRVQTRVFDSRARMEHAVVQFPGGVCWRDPRQAGGVQQTRTGRRMVMAACCVRVHGNHVKTAALLRQGVRAVVLVHAAPTLAMSSLAHELVHAAFLCCALRHGRGTQHPHFEEDVATMTDWLLREGVRAAMDFNISLVP